MPLPPRFSLRDTSALCAGLEEDAAVEDELEGLVAGLNGTGMARNPAIKTDKEIIMNHSLIPLQKNCRGTCKSESPPPDKIFSPRNVGVFSPKVKTRKSEVERKSNFGISSFVIRRLQLSW